MQARVHNREGKRVSNAVYRLYGNPFPSNVTSADAHVGLKYCTRDGHGSMRARAGSRDRSIKKNCRAFAGRQTLLQTWRQTDDRAASSS